MRKTKTLISTFIALGLLAVPSTLAQETAGVTGITLQTAPNAVAVSWQAPSGVMVDHYTVYYAKQSILQNNGKFDDKESTFGDETSLVLLDLKNRGFRDGETIFVTVTYTNVNGQENTTFAEEQGTKVKVPGTANAEYPHDSAPPPPTGTTSALILEQAVAENLTSVRLRFSAFVRFSAESASQNFSITEENTGNPVAVLSAMSEGTDVVLTTLPMIARTRYIVSVSDTVAGVDGALLDPAKREATFVARGKEEIIVPQLLDLPPELDHTPPEPPRDLVLEKILQRDGFYRVEASWEESLNTGGDLQSYNVYESANLGKIFVGPTALRATVASTTIANVPPGTLTVKLTAMDRVGNESRGIEETIILPETGAMATVLLSFAGASLWASRRKRR